MNGRSRGRDRYARRYALTLSEVLDVEEAAFALYDATEDTSDTDRADRVDRALYVLREIEAQSRRIRHAVRRLEDIDGRSTEQR